jgi:hypothetical protein
MGSLDDPRLSAIHFLRLALNLLDQSDAPSDIGAHADAAISRLSEVLGQPDPPPNGGDSITSQTPKIPD